MTHDDIRFEIAELSAGPVLTCWICRERLASIGCLVCGYAYCRQCLALLVNHGTNAPKACAGCGEYGEILGEVPSSAKDAAPPFGEMNR